MIAYLLAPVFLYGIFATGSRTGLIALVATPLLALFVPRLAARLGWRILPMYVLGAAAIAVMVLAIPSVASPRWNGTRLSPRSRAKRPGMGGGPTGRGRSMSSPLIRSWASGRETTRRLPWTTRSRSKHIPSQKGERSQVLLITSFLGVASQLGLVGLILFLGMLFFVFKTAVPIAQRSDLGTGIFLGLIVAMIAGMTLPWERPENSVLPLRFGPRAPTARFGSTRTFGRQARKAHLIRVMHVVTDFPAAVEPSTVAANLLRTADPEQFDARAISLRGPFGSEGLEETLAQDGIPVWYMGKERGFDPSVVARVARTLEHFRPHVVHTHTYALRYALPYMLWRRVPAMVHTVHNLAEREDRVVRALGAPAGF